MATVLLILALIPTATLVAAMVIRSIEPRSTWGGSREKGRWTLSPDSRLHAKSKYRRDPKG
ncbi:MAG: hypothetical protein LC722_05290 [Actinobacteria bacterium]|nr:hypothetical protein [Actinomycetota bacterium]